MLNKVMRKFILIPVVNLGADPNVIFLEIISESACFCGVDFQNLKNSGLAKEVAKTEKILSYINYPKLSSSHLYLSYHFLNTDGLSISLGLTLAAFFQQKDCRYQKIVAIGEIDIHSSHLPVLGGRYIDTQIAAILALGKQPNAVALFFPAQLLNETSPALIYQLTELNFEVKLVSTLNEALISLGVA